MSDTVRKALRVAQREASSFYSLSETAAIIAAFLRALRPCDVLMDRPGDLGPHSTVTLAAAVEEAARDG